MNPIGWRLPGRAAYGTVGPNEQPQGGISGCASLRLLATAATFAIIAGPAAAETVKVGFIPTTSGPFASLGLTMDNAMKLFVAKNGDSVGGHKVEIIRRDEPVPTRKSPSGWPRS